MQQGCDLKGTTAEEDEGETTEKEELTQHVNTTIT
jgi:hypothetical protein